MELFIGFNFNIAMWNVKVNKLEVPNSHLGDQ